MTRCCWGLAVKERAIQPAVKANDPSIQIIPYEVGGSQEENSLPQVEAWRRWACWNGTA